MADHLDDEIYAAAGAFPGIMSQMGGGFSQGPLKSGFFFAASGEKEAGF